MYRFLLTPRWLAAAALAVAAAVVMVLLGNWQLHRYQERSAINNRIDAADSAPALPLNSVLAAPGAAGTAGPSPGKTKAWTKVTATGRYDVAHEIQARGRTVDGDVGFEIVTPLLLSDGTAVLVDRGWIPPAAGGATAAPTVPVAPSGQVTVEGQVHLSESRPTPIEHRDGRLDTRRINLPRLAKEMPYPVYGAYLLLTSQTPANDPAFSAIPIDHEDAWQNGGYAIQWWMFAVMALLAYGWQARKEALGDDDAEGAARPKEKPRGDRVAEYDRRAAANRSGDRVEEHDRRVAAARAAAQSGDRVEEHDRRVAAARAAAESGDRVEEHDRRVAAAQAASESADRVEEHDRKAAAARAAAEPGSAPGDAAARPE